MRIREEAERAIHYLDKSTEERIVRVLEGKKDGKRKFDRRYDFYFLFSFYILN